MPLTNGKKYYLTGSAFVGGSAFLAMTDSASVSIRPGASTSTTVYTVAKIASGSYMEMTGSGTATAATTGVRPNAGPSSSAALGDCWVLGPILGTFSSGVWTVNLQVVGGTNTSQGKYNLKFLKGSSISGSDALGFQGGQVLGTTNVGVNTTSQSVATASLNLSSSLIFNNEYLFIQAAWGITLAGGSNGTSVTHVQGSGSFITMSAFEDTSFMIWNHDDNPGFGNIP